jgi:alpha-glucosidase
VLAFRRGGFVSLTNFGDVPARLDAASEVLLSSRPLSDGLVPGDTTVWARLRRE